VKKQLWGKATMPQNAGKAEITMEVITDQVKERQV
jgi:hypothetical protein